VPPHRAARRHGALAIGGSRCPRRSSITR